MRQLVYRRIYASLGLNEWTDDFFVQQVNNVTTVDT